MSRPRAQLRLIAPEPEKTKLPEPRRAQMKALQYMRTGAKLVFQTRPVQRIDLEKGPVWFLIHPTTARILVAYRWVELHDFNANRGIYRLHESGLALTERVCEHRHLPFSERIMKLNERRLCRDCWRVVERI